MALPPDYNTTRDYFVEVLDLLKTYHWVYCFANNTIIVNKVFDRFPREWLPYLKKLNHKEINDLLMGKITEEIPKSLKQFLQKIDSMKLIIDKDETEDFNYKFPNNSGLADKKKHEIMCFAPLIHKICTDTGCKDIVDVGTGVGYLPQLLFKKYNYRTIGIEGSATQINLAKTHQKKHPESVDSVHFIEHYLTDQSEEFLKDLGKKYSVENACITGLHACADLSITILELFTKLDFSKSLLIMPCCYHRLKEAEDGFVNFPASNLLKDLVVEKDAKRFLNVPFLRLACQGTIGRFFNQTEAERAQYANCCLFRAILQEVAEAEGCQVRRIKRKSGKLKESDPFEQYLNNIQSSHELIGMDITDENFLKKMREKWLEHKGNAYLTVALAAFQAALQSVCENVVLLDRVMFLTEKGVKCFVAKVTDQGISPRCHALMAFKP